LGGAVADYPGRKISGTEDAVLYQTCRYNFDGYNLKVPNGRYRVTVGFCEPHFGKAAEGIGDFKLQGKTAVQELDNQIELLSLGEDFEYRVEITTADGANLTWPASAPEINQTVVAIA
jgi:hypothetical protein